VTITLAFLALLMGAVAWWLVKQSVNVQPWVAAGAGRDVHASVLAQPPAKTALWVFLAVATSLFALFVSAYAMRINYLDWTPLPQPKLLTFNTAVLVLASIAMQCAMFAARRGDVPGVKSGLIVAGLLTLGFVAGQLAVWKQLQDAGYFIANSAATGFFYMLTAVHGLHVLGGLVAWSRTSARAWQGVKANRLQLAVELCATYWHFLLVVWLVLFAVLASNFLGLSICSTSVPL
jgi:cytochrome c oxidase subunit III